MPQHKTRLGLVMVCLCFTGACSALEGVQLEAKLENRPCSQHWWCPRNSNWFTVWLNPRVLLPGQFPCFVDALRLRYDPSTNGSLPQPGVQVRPTHGFDHPMLGPFPSLRLSIFGDLMTKLKQLGWRDEEMQTHIYDWRRAPSDWLSHPHHYKQMKEEIERMYHQSGQAVTLVALSLGSTYANLFLTEYVDEGWKAKYINSMLTISGAWGGTAVSVYDVIAGRLEGLERLFNRQDVLALIRSVPSLSWTMPAPQLFSNDVIVTNKITGQTYTAARIGQALQDSGALQASHFWSSSLPYMLAKPPNVTLYCMYSVGLSTPASLVFHTEDFSDKPNRVQVIYQDGDETVPTKSLAVCESWRHMQAAKVETKVYKGVVHGMLQQEKEALEYMVHKIAYG